MINACKYITRCLGLFKLFCVLFLVSPGFTFAQNEKIDPLKVLETALRWTQHGDEVNQALFDNSPKVNTLAEVSLELAEVQEDMLQVLKQVNLQVPSIVDAEFKGNKFRQIRAEIDDFGILSASGRWDGGLDAARDKSQRLDVHIAHVIDYGPTFFPTYLSLANILFGLQRSAGFSDKEIATVLKQQADSISVWLEGDQHDLVGRLKEEFRSQRILLLASERRWLVFDVGTFIYKGEDQFSTASVMLRFERDGASVTPDVLIHESKGIVEYDGILLSPYKDVIKDLDANSFVFFSGDIDVNLVEVFPVVFGRPQTHYGKTNLLQDAEEDLKSWAEEAIVEPIRTTIASHVANAETHNSDYKTLSDLVEAIENYIGELDARRVQILGGDQSSVVTRSSILIKPPVW